MILIPKYHRRTRKQSLALCRLMAIRSIRGSIKLIGIVGKQWGLEALTNHICRELEDVERLVESEYKTARDYLNNPEVPD